MRTLATVFKALSDETRLQMLALLLEERELCVCDVMAVLKISQSKASRHLRILYLAGLLEDRREAVWVHYRIADELDRARTTLVGALREVLPGIVPAELFRELRAWKKRRARGESCIPEKRSAGGASRCARSAIVGELAIALARGGQASDEREHGQARA